MPDLEIDGHIKVFDSNVDDRESYIDESSIQVRTDSYYSPGISGSYGYNTYTRLYAGRCQIGHKDTPLYAEFNADELCFCQTNLSEPDYRREYVHLSAWGNLSLGAEGHDGDVVIKNANDAITIGLNGESGHAVLGGGGVSGEIRILSPSGDDATSITGGNIRLGGGGADGDLMMTNSADGLTIGLNGESGHGLFGGHGATGAIYLIDSDGRHEVLIDAVSARTWTDDTGARVAQLDLISELKQLRDRVARLETEVAALSSG